MRQSSDGLLVVSSEAVPAGDSVTRDVGDLDGLETAWTTLAAGAAWASPVMHHGWARCCLETRGPDEIPALVTVGGARIRAIAPLVRDRGWARPLEFLGQAALAEPMDFLYGDAADLVALADAVAATRRPLRLGRIWAESPTVAALIRAYGKVGVVRRRPAPDCPWIPLDPSWENPERHVNSGRRSDLRRARRIADGMGRVSVEIVAPSAADLAPLLDEAFAVEAMGWKGRDGTALLLDQRRGAFFRRWAAAARDKGILRLCFLRIGGRAAAMQLALESGGRFWLLKIGYSDAFARCSPGLLLMVESIAHAARSGLDSYEFLGTSEPWIGSWTPHTRSCVSLSAYPFGVAGLSALARDALRAAPAKFAGVFRNRGGV